MTTGGSNYYYFRDGLGSVRNLVDSSEVAQNTYDYRAFGQNITASESVTSPYRYTGRSYETGGLGVYNYRNRYYYSGLGIFMSRDAMFADVHRGWGYVGNMPSQLTDPYGLFWLWDLLFGDDGEEEDDCPASKKDPLDNFQAPVPKPEDFEFPEVPEGIKDAVDALTDTVGPVRDILDDALDIPNKVNNGVRALDRMMRGRGPGSQGNPDTLRPGDYRNKAWLNDLYDGNYPGMKTWDTPVRIPKKLRRPPRQVKS